MSRHSTLDAQLFAWFAPLPLLLIWQQIFGLAWAANEFQPAVADCGFFADLRFSIQAKPNFPKDRLTKFYRSRKKLLIT